jgi:hypothetical protein
MGRKYNRDARGRFASGGSGGGSKARPVAKPRTRGANRLTRDNAGRITSVGGNGATARGGRLRTAAGNQRATQTARIKRPRIIKPGQGAKQKPNATAKKPLERGTLVRGNFRPMNTMGRQLRPDGTFGKDKKANVNTAIRLLQQQLPSDVKVQRRGQNRSSLIMGWSPSKRTMYVNTSHGFWNDPTRHSRNWRRDGSFSSSNPKALIAHEIGHVRHRTLNENRYFNTVDNRVSVKGGRLNSLRLARRVSRYAMTNPDEFVAEVRAGRATGRRYDHKVMRAYRAAAGLSKTSVRKPVRRRRR